jgi:hypothetical protein
MYDPQVNDYVYWNDRVEGWIYFKGDEYITIEANVRPKDKQNYHACRLHRNDRLLVLCYHNQWNELEYVTTRESVHEEKENNVEMVGEGTWGEGNEK